MNEKEIDIVPTGIPGLDDILLGGLTAGKVYLLSGAMPEEKYLALQLHELFLYLTQTHPRNFP